MSFLTIEKTYEDGDILFEADLDAIVNSLEEYFNTIGIGSQSILDNSIDTNHLAPGQIDGSKIAPGSIDESYLGAIPARALSEAAITYGKLAPASTTSSYVVFPLTANGSNVIISDYENPELIAEIEFTPAGNRPVLVTLIPAAGTYSTLSTTTAGSFIEVLDTTFILEDTAFFTVTLTDSNGYSGKVSFRIGHENGASGNQPTLKAPPGAVSFIIPPSGLAPEAVTYTLEGMVGGDGWQEARLRNCAVFITELL